MEKLNIKSVTSFELRQRINRIKKNNPTIPDLYLSFAVRECETILDDNFTYPRQKGREIAQHLALCLRNNPNNMFDKHINSDNVK